MTLKEYEAIDFRPSLTLVPPAAYLGKLNPVNASHPTGDTYSRVNRHASPLDNPFMPISFSSWCLRLFFVAVNNWFSLLAYVAPLGFFFFAPKKTIMGVINTCTVTTQVSGVNYYLASSQIRAGSPT